MSYYIVLIKHQVCFGGLLFNSNGKIAQEAVKIKGEKVKSRNTI